MMEKERTSLCRGNRYERYHWSRIELVAYFLLYTGVSLTLSWVFYQSVKGVLPIGAVVLPLGLKRKNRELRERRKQRLTIEFTDCIRLVAGGLAAGYSMENAWENAGEDLRKMHGSNSDMYQELLRINTGVRLHMPIEGLLEDFASRSGLEDVDNFCQVISFAKRSGGNLVKITENTVKQISGKRGVLEEIETVLSAKRLEQKIMNVIPLLLLAYVGISSPEFISPLYQNLFGRLVMSACLMIYGLAFLLSERIVRIEV